MSEIQDRMVENVNDGFSALCRRLAASLSVLFIAQRRDIGVAMSTPTASICKLHAVSEIELAKSATHIAGGSSAN